MYRKTNGSFGLLRRFCIRDMSLFKKKMTFFTFFTWLWTEFRILLVQMKPNCKIIVTIEFFVQNGPWHICQTTHLKSLGWWSFLTWHWTLSELDMKIRLSQYLRLVLVSTYGRVLAKNANFEVSTVRNLKTSYFDFWPDLDLTRDLMLKIRGPLIQSRRYLSNAGSGRIRVVGSDHPKRWWV